MKIPTIHGFIDRRILINFTADPEVVAKIIPAPFSPKVYKGKAIVGICLIRLKEIKPKGIPAFLGISSENGAHRIAVEWDENGLKKEGVYIPRRDTSSKLNALLGGRFFPGKHHLANFNTQEEAGHYIVSFVSSDDTYIKIDAKEGASLHPDSIFDSIEEVSGFFEQGAVGYSPNRTGFDGLKLSTYKWEVKPLQVSTVNSSFFENEQIFPKGSVRFDNALLMTNIEHEWLGLAQK
jgi:hypothetical protein